MIKIYECEACGFEGTKKDMINGENHTGLSIDNDDWRCHDELVHLGLAKDVTYKMTEYKCWDGTYLT